MMASSSIIIDQQLDVSICIYHVVSTGNNRNSQQVI